MVLSRLKSTSEELAVIAQYEGGLTKKVGTGRGNHRRKVSSKPAPLAVVGGVCLG